MRPDFNRGVFYKMTEGKRVGAVFFLKDGSACFRIIYSNKI
ncbi:hypothetical protein TEGAF0_00780 [Sediminibacterium sp. TEGAF015]|nr:hypothetical protein TEGAF0_00780 [Sediminibacterium sp. TEGAF015]